MHTTRYTLREIRLNMRRYVLSFSDWESRGMLAMISSRWSLGSECFGRSKYT